MNRMNPALESAVEMAVSAFRAGGKMMICGNGGSAADSAHITGELVKGFLKRRPLPKEWDTAMNGLPLQMGLPCIDLTAQGAVISAIANDLGGDLIFAQQVMAYANPGDILIGISTSGNAENVCLALRAAKMKGAKCIGLTGPDGGRMNRYCDLMLKADAANTHLVQEEHIRMYHEFCARIEAAFFDI